MQSDNHNTVTEAREDLTGRNQMTRNVLVSWAGHFVFIVAGFILPRMIDRHIGQEALGIWDFGWSLVSYFQLVQAGIGSSINRYVAKYRVVGDVNAVNCTVSSVFCILLVAAAGALALTALAVWHVPDLLNRRLGMYVPEARWIIGLLGISLAVRMVFTVFAGVITGSHRWDIHNVVQAGGHVGTVGVMITALILGGGLIELAFITLCGTVFTEGIRAGMAHRVFPELRVRFGLARWSEARRMMAFGGKTFVRAIANLLLYQTSSILVVSYLGPGALAIYARQSSLVHHGKTLVEKFSRVLTPTASCLHAMGRLKELRELLIQTTRYSVYMALPMVLLFSILGDPILNIWMGPDYEQGSVLAILAVGHLLLMICRPAWNILVGMNAHGRVAFANLLGAMVAVPLGILAIGQMRLGLPGAAVAIALPLTIVNGVYVPIYVCRLLDMSYVHCAKSSLAGPLFSGILFAMCLFLAKHTYPENPAASLALGLGTGGLVLAVFYWRYALPQQIRIKLTQLTGQVFRRLAMR